jgi:hypothetical protein
VGVAILQGLVWLGSRSQLKPVIEMAQMLKLHLENLLTCLKYHITNAKQQSS